MTKEQLEEYRWICTDVWKLIRKYSSDNRNEEFWESYCDEIGELHKKYNESEFSKALLMAVTDELERIDKCTQEK